MTDQLRQAAMQQALVDVITVTLMREGINKHRARELADHFVNFTLTPPLPVQEPVAWLYPEGLKALQNGKCWTAYPTQHEDCNTPLYIAMPPMPVQEPVARVIDNGTPEGATEWIPFTNRVEPLETGDLLYTAPPKQRQPLAASEILNMMPGSIPAEYDGPLMEFARAIEAKLKELNK